MRWALLGPAALVWVARATMRGVSPEMQARYSGATFRCLDGKGEVSSQAVNDDFCDCADGSDEPGTGACAGQDVTLFHCVNEGATPQLIYSSRVDDGVCDCCDGSDEAGLAKRRPGSVCANRCVEEGAQDLQARAARIENLKVGLERKAQIIEGAKVDRITWQSDLNRLNGELPALEAALEEAKAEAAKGGGQDALQAEVETLRKQVADLKNEVAELKSQLEVATGGAAQASGEEAAKPATEKKVVSEYAKWMEGAGSTPGAVETPPEELEEDEADDNPGPTRPVVNTAGSSPSSSKVAEAEGNVRSNKDSARALEKKLSQVSDDKLGFASLVDKCLSKHDGQYNYNVCFFDDAKQDHVLLGRWDSWSDDKVAKFSHGHMCPGGPERELRVIFECGSKEEVVDVSEPSRCSYEAHVTHPGACAEEDMAALEKPPVKHPRDEL